MQISTNHNSKFYQGDCREKLEIFDAETFQAIIADPPYFQVLLGEDWDNQWQTEEDYLKYVLMKNFADYYKDYLNEKSVIFKNLFLF